MPHIATYIYFQTQEEYRALLTMPGTLHHDDDARQYQPLSDPPQSVRHIYLVTLQYIYCYDTIELDLKGYSVQVLNF